MFHEIEDIQHELARLSRRPSPEDAPPVLCAFDVRTSTPVPDFEARMRSILAPALQLAVVHPYDGSDLPVDTLPDWFVAAARGSSASVPEFVSHGAERYAAALDQGPWDLQEWLYQFDPESESRGWAWWDVTQSGENKVRIWVDTWGESFFACNELRWGAYISGGAEVAGPILVRTSEWVAAVTP
ncbi:hypothetical protein [Streptomyces sp. NPDC088348]|uniref:hypothetical protein n=1 Tax=Streptomyces sp. NPDC088348 TaxID=3365853 RepID=UPI003805EB5E